METIISALITGVVAIVVNVISNKAQHEKTVALLEYRLLELEKKQDKHNNVIERTFELEKRADVFEEKIKVANHRIDDIEKSK